MSSHNTALSRLLIPKYLSKDSSKISFMPFSLFVDEKILFSSSFLLEQDNPFNKYPYL